MKKTAALLFLYAVPAFFPQEVFSQAASRIAGSGVEYYPSLNEAFTAALVSTEGGSLDKPDEITLLEDIVLTEPILIDKTRHIRLVAGNGGRTVYRGSANIDNPLFRITGEAASLCLGKPGMEHELVIDGGYGKNPPVRSLSPLIVVNGLDSKLIMHDKVTLQNNYNECAAPPRPRLYQNGAGVFIRTLESKQNRQAEFIMKGGTIRGNVNNTQNHVACGGGCSAGIVEKKGSPGTYRNRQSRSDRQERRPIRSGGNGKAGSRRRHEFVSTRKRAIHPAADGSSPRGIDNPNPVRPQAAPVQPDRKRSLMSKPLTKKTTDHSNDDGFSFSFFCDRCGKEWISRPVPFEAGKYTAIEHTEIKERLWTDEHRTAFAEANLEAHFYFYFGV